MTEASCLWGVKLCPVKILAPFFLCVWWKNPSFDKLAVILVIYFTGIYIVTAKIKHTTKLESRPRVSRSLDRLTKCLKPWCPWHIIFWMVSSNPMQNSFFSTVSRWQMEEIKFNSFRANLNGCERLASPPALWLHNTKKAFEQRDK